jgi:predicted SpoU family rRNA methylase
MKISLCCSVVPIEFATGISSLDMGLCPRCSEHTEFVDLVYKVKHEYGGEFYTTSNKEARQRFKDYRDDRCEGVRLYEGLATSDDTDEIDWELIDCYNVAFKEEEVYENN